MRGHGVEAESLRHFRRAGQLADVLAGNETHRDETKAPDGGDQQQCRHSHRDAVVRHGLTQHPRVGSQAELEGGLDAV